MKTIHSFSACLVCVCVAGSIGCNPGRMLSLQDRNDPMEDSSMAMKSFQPTPTTHQNDEQPPRGTWDPAHFESVKAAGNSSGTIEDEVALVSRSITPSTADLDFRASDELPTLITLQRGQDLSEAVGQSAGTVVLDFYADWCGPCQKQGMILHDLESLAKARQVRIIKVNVDEHPDLARQMNVASLPTLMRIQDGQIVDRQTGLADRRKLDRWLN